MIAACNCPYVTPVTYQTWTVRLRSSSSICVDAKATREIHSMSVHPGGERERKDLTAVSPLHAVSNACPGCGNMKSLLFEPLVMSQSPKKKLVLIFIWSRLQLFVLQQLVDDPRNRAHIYSVEQTLKCKGKGAQTSPCSLFI